MSDIQMGGGWGDSILAHCSPAIAHRVAQADADAARQDAASNRERSMLKEMWQEDAVRISLSNAAQRGQAASGLQELSEGIGRTPAEVFAYANAQMDRADALQARVMAKAGLTEADLSSNAPEPIGREAGADALAARADADASRTRAAALHQASRAARSIAREEASRVGNLVLGAAVKLATGDRW